MSKIVLISSGESITNCGLRLKAGLSRPEDLQIVEGYMETALDYVNTRLTEDTDVIIARGNTAKLLKSSRPPVPVVTIPITDSELLMAIEKAKDSYGADDAGIGYIGLEDVVNAVKNFLGRLNYKVRLYPVSSSSDINRQVLQAKQDHIGTLIGGVLTCRLAAENGLNCVLLESSYESVKEAYERAREVQNSFHAQKKKLRERNILFTSVSEGILIVNETGVITSRNPAAAAILGPEAAAGTCPHYGDYLSFQDADRVLKCLSSGKQESAIPVLIGGRRFALDVHPVTVRQKKRGAVLILRTSGAPVQTGGSHAKETASPDASPASFSELAGRSPRLQNAVRLGQKYAGLSCPVLITGETGTGRETLARCIHMESHRAKAPFISRGGRSLTAEDFTASEGGTLCIRNFETMEPGLQEIAADLIRGRRRSRTRIIVTASVSYPELLPLINQGKLLPEFYYLLGQAVLDLPPLRERPEDLEDLCRFFASRHKRNGMTPSPRALESLKQMSGFQWPGNLLELELFALDPAPFLQKHSAPAPLPLPDPVEAGKAFVIHGNRVTQQQLEALNQYYNGNKTLIAKHLGVSRSTLWRYYKEME